MTTPGVLLFTEFFHPHTGGIETHVLTLARELQRAGLRVEVATPFPGPETVEGVRVHRLAAPLLPRVNMIWTTHAAAPFMALLRDGGFDVVHSHVSIYSPASAAAAFLAYRAGLATLVTFHSVLGPYKSALALLDRLTGWSRLPLRFTAVSDVVASDVRSLLGDRSCVILPPACDLERWSPAASSQRPGMFRIVSTMRLVQRKRPGALVEAIARVKALLAGSLRLRARIIGEGNERRRVERLIAARGLGGEVTLCGTLARAQLRAEYADADVFVLSSIEESFGLAALEARVAGLPVVVLSSSGAAQFIRHELEGLVVGSDNELSDALVRLASDPALRARIALHNRTTTPAFSREELVRAHRAIYAEAMAARTPRATRGAT